MDFCSEFSLHNCAHKEFSHVVNVTDEALVLHVVKTYFEGWGSGKDDDSGASAQKKVKKIDMKNTLVKTRAEFYGYVARVKKTRNSKHRKEWDLMLQELARAKVRDKKRKHTGEGSEEPPSHIANFAMDYMHGVFDVDMFSDDVGQISEA